MKVLLCPDKFKGSLSASEVCDHLEKGLKAKAPDIEVIKLPLADGGEGTLDVLSMSMPLTTETVAVNDPLFRPVEATYARSGDKAFIEMAKASGLQLLDERERNCMHTTTYGTGELIAHALNQGVKEVYLFIGGSATNDGGIGMAAALGYVFYDASGRQLKPVGSNLAHITDFSWEKGKSGLDGVKCYVVTDVTNPFFGPAGAARMYASQKGANEKEVEALDMGLKNLRDLMRSKTGVDVQVMAGTGAAGGLGGGAKVFLNAEIKNGIETVFQLTGFKEKLTGVNLVITGEGKLDEQTLNGKLVYGVCEFCHHQNIPTAIICGTSELSNEQIKSLKAKKVIQLVDPHTSTQEAISNAGALLEKHASQLI